MRSFVRVLCLCSLVSTVPSKGPSGAVQKVREGAFKCPISPVTARYPDPTSKFCLYYFLCHKGHAFPRMCGPRQAFHPITLECKNREEIPEYLCPFEIECGFNGYQIDPKDCTKYYLCFYKQPTHFSCTEGKVFNKETSTCKLDRAKAKICSKPTPPPHYANQTRKSITTTKPHAAVVPKILNTPHPTD